MSYLTFKALNSALWFSTTVLSWGQWLIMGTPETPELKLARQNQQRLDRMESKIDQLWAIESGLCSAVPVNESLILVSQDGSTSKKPRSIHHTSSDSDSDSDDDNKDILP